MNEGPSQFGEETGDADGPRLHHREGVTDGCHIAFVEILIVRIDSAMALRRAFVISSMFIVSNGMMLVWFGVLTEHGADAADAR